MAKRKISTWEYECERCNHKWIPRDITEPRVCPKCKSPYWNKPRRVAAALLAKEKPSKTARKIETK